MAEKVGKKIEQGIWENVDKDGNFDGTYCVRLARRFKIDNGARTSKPLFYRRRRIASLAQAKKEKRKGEDTLAARAIKLQSGDKTWKEAKAQYMTYLYNRLEDKSMSPSTVENIRLTLEKHTKQWDTKMISWFNIEIFETYLNSAELKKELTYATRKGILKFVGQVFKRQIALGITNNNPTKGVHIRRGVGELDLSQDQEPKIMQKEDVYKVLDYAEEHFPEWHLVYKFAFLTGLRSGEQFSLVWKNVDLERNLIHVKTSYDWKTEKILNTPKGKQNRSVPINPSLRKMLMELKLKATSDFVLPRIDDWKNGKAAEVLRNMQKAVGLDYTTNFHALRGSYCTTLLLADVAPIIVQKLMGHRSFKTTQIYIDLVGLDVANAADGLERDVIPLKKKKKAE